MKRKPREYLMLDANDSIFFESELDVIKATSYDIEYPQLLARTLFPVDTSVDTGAKTITYQTYDQVGMAKLIHAYAQDLPNVEISGKQTTVTIYSLGVSFGYSIQDVRSSRLAGKNLEQRKANAARYQMLLLENDLAFNGDPRTSIEPFINHPNSLKPTIPLGAGGSTTWALKTPDEIIKDINLLVSAIRSTTNGIEAPNTLLLPETQYAQISSTPKKEEKEREGRREDPFVQSIIPVWNLKGAGPSGVDVMILYDRSPDKLTLEIPQDIEFLPVQEKALMFEIPVHSRTAGVIVYYPRSVAQGDGI
jgi:hypothetical protein